MPSAQAKLFLKRLTAFTAVGVLLYVGLFATLDRLFHLDRGNTVYVWGDSQMFQGFDLNLFTSRTGQAVLSAAAHGSGVYDFLVFCDKVPRGAEVYVSLSKPALVRNLDKDYNRTGLSLFALDALRKHGYSISEIFKILWENDKFPKSIYHRYFGSTPYSDTIVVDPDMAEYELAYSRVPEFLDRKEELYLLGLRTLLEKKCRLTLIEFPYHRLLSEIESHSEIKALTDAFKEEVRSLTRFKEVNVTLNAEKSLMRDLTHLNATGAAAFTEAIIERRMRDEAATTLYSLNGGTCD
jgi:hypothetical protein